MKKLKKLKKLKPYRSESTRRSRKVICAIQERIYLAMDEHYSAECEVEALTDVLNHYKSTGHLRRDYRQDILKGIA